MKILSDPSARQEILDRLQNVSPRSQRKWGRMTSHQMVCHLSDSYKGVIGLKSLGRVDNLFSRSLIKWVALRSPTPWPHGTKTMPEMDQMIGGTPPGVFEADMTELQALVSRVSSQNRDFNWSRHPFFGEMSEWEWQRWAYLHTDHHLRQFNV